MRAAYGKGKLQTSAMLILRISAQKKIRAALFASAALKFDRQ
jgi:hypothetical protein